MKKMMMKHVSLSLNEMLSPHEELCFHSGTNIFVDEIFNGTGRERKRRAGM